MQALITRSEQRFNSTQGLHRIDTEQTRAKGFVPTPIEAAPHLARHAAERSATHHQHSRPAIHSEPEYQGKPLSPLQKCAFLGVVAAGYAVMFYGLVRLTTGA
jgi:hypothetical protein